MYSQDYMNAMEDEIRGLHDLGFARMEIENRVDRASEEFTILYQHVYSIANEVGMKIDFRVGGTGSVRILPGVGFGGAVSSVTGSESRQMQTTDDLLLEGGSILTRGAELTGSASGEPSEYEIYAVEAIRYTEASGENIQQEIINLDPALFVLNSQEGSMEAAGDATGEQGFSLIYQGDDLTIGTQGETWSIVCYYLIPTSQEDFYSVASARAFTEKVDQVFSDPELKRLVQENGGFMTSDGGDGNQRITETSWSDELEAKFSAAYGYDLKSYLPVIYSGYKLEDGQDVRVMNDWQNAFCLLNADFNSFITDWAEREYNSSWRSQVGYSTDVNNQIAAMSVGQSDVESLWNASELDSYLVFSSVRNLTGRAITANECGAMWTRSDYACGYKDLISVANASFAAGINQQIFHVMSFPYSEKSPWPGFLDWNAELMDWGKASPGFRDTDLVVDYVNRAQTVLRSGTPKRDLLVYIQTNGDRYEIDDAVVFAGYTYDIVSDALLTTDKAQTVADGIIDPEGGEYRAFVISGLLDGQYMDINTAETILKYAKYGVPIIVVGEENIPAKTTGFAQSGRDQDLADIFDEINEMGMLTVIASETGLPEALDALKIAPNLKKDESSTIESYMVRDAEGNSYYFLYNADEFSPALNGTYQQKYSAEEQQVFFPEKAAGVYYRGEEVRQTVSLKGSGTPYAMDLWTGAIMPIADYTVNDGYVDVTVSLKGGEGTILALTNESSDKPHAVQNSEDIEIFYDLNGQVAVKTTETGTYTVSMSDGTAVTIRAAETAAPFELTGWDLTVESYTPAYEFGTVGIAGASSEITVLETTLDSLKSWSEIEEIGPEVSGIGYYTTSFAVDGDCDGAYLNVGDVFDLARVYVNGQEVILNQNKKTADLEGVLIEGENTITIVTSSDYMNQYAAHGGTKNQLDYGLFGPVTITPYRICVIEDQR